MAEPQRPAQTPTFQAPLGGTSLRGPAYEILFTTLPDGMEGENLKFSVLLSPRLLPGDKGPGGALGQLFGLFLTTGWPAFVAALKFNVHFESLQPGVQPPQPLPTVRISTPPDPHLWPALFKPETWVRPYKFDRHELLTKFDIQPPFPEKNLVEDIISQLIQPVALGAAKFKLNEQIQLPAKGLLLQKFEQTGIISQNRVGFQNPRGLLNTLRTTLSQTLRQPGTGFQPPRLPQGGVMPRGIERQPSGRKDPIPRNLTDSQARSVGYQSAAQLNFLQYQAFTQHVIRPGPRPPTTEQLRQELDFHQLISRYSDYPELLRKLGLLLDFTLKLPPNLPATGTVYVRPSSDDPARYISPKTAYTLQGGFRSGLSASPGYGRLQDGFIKLGLLDFRGNPFFDVVPGDVEGIAKKIENFAQTLLQATASSPEDTSGLPALRSSGLGVADRSRHDWLNEMLERISKTKGDLDGEPKPPPKGQVRGTSVVLYAESLLRGLRIDVRELRRVPNAPLQPGPWRSLCFRRGQYFLGPNLPPAFTHDDEGWVALGLTKETVVPDPNRPSIIVDVLKTYESLFRWGGWSLSVPRPGRESIEEPSAPKGDPITPIKLRVAFTPVPRTLPRLRFGRQYQFRARVVDLAGNSPKVTDLQSTPETLVTRINDGYYDRFDPLGSPLVVLTQAIADAQGNALSPGEDVARLVIRTFNVETQGQVPAGPPSSSSARHILPPKTSQELAEAHGKFDNSETGLVRGQEAYQLMTAKDGSLLYAVHSEPEMTLPYLADPLAAGATLFVYDPAGITPATLFPQAFGGDWPNLRPFRLSLVEGNTGPQFQNGVLRVSLPLGEQRKVQLSSFLLPGDEELMGIWRWIKDPGAIAPGSPTAPPTPQEQEKMRELVKAGRHWMITPFRDLELVHATQQPVLTPRWLNLRVCPERKPSETSATLDGVVGLHLHSTGKLDIQAEWVEPIDDVRVPLKDPYEVVNQVLVNQVQGKAHAFEVPVPLVNPLLGQVRSRGVSEESPGGPPLGEQTPPGEIQSRGEPSEAPETPPETTAPLEESPAGEVQPRGAPGGFPGPQMPGQFKPPVQPLPAQPGGQARPPQQQQMRPSCPDPTLPAPLPGEFHFQFGLSENTKHYFGDTKYRRVAYKVVATTRYREYFLPLPCPPPAPGTRSNPCPPEPIFTRTSVPAPPPSPDPGTILVLSSAPPDAPKPLYVVPTFRWDKSAPGSSRRFGGLRVYLDRPWFSSGDGEQLAVVLFQAPLVNIPEHLKPYITQLGLDPLWEGPPAQKPGSSQFQIQPGQPGVSPPQVVAGPPPPLSPDIAVTKFRNAVEARGDLRLEELPSQQVTICAFDVRPDLNRQLWYCDIELATGDYFPFIRLALARYQKHSIWGAHLSKVVLADFAQLVPDRTVSLAINPSSPNVALVSLTGPAADKIQDRWTQIEVTIEEQVPQPKGSAGEQSPDEQGKLRWVPLPAQPVGLKLSAAGQWTGQVPLPPQGPTPLRLVFKEYEVFQVSEPDSARQVEKRLVFADTLVLNR